ncbi:MAG: hypothetical protein KBG28_19990 [Kofleriaceae bacterium]|jgi:hypothetical protein|nr:hypothetical protein [Kofleriaceae bacterium]MBP6836624.1 hypothetical protein [Kofleriaceae bacterium]MBP9206264.1 hypothetical protein [Kofleriaceae bacterium]
MSHDPTTGARTAVDPPAADQPPLPTTRRGLGTWITLGLATAVVGGYLVLSFIGWDTGGSTSRDNVPTSVRSSPGGYRAYHFWHTGYMGGK